MQGSGAESPFVGKRVTVEGVVTMVLDQKQNGTFTVKQPNGKATKQWTSEDGFFMEAKPGDKDLSGTKSNGIFVNAHEALSSDPKWKTGITKPTAGNIVKVTGIVRETCKKDRFLSNEGNLTRTEIDIEKIETVSSSGNNFPDGVLLTYSETNKTNWLNGHTDDGKREARIIPFDDKSPDAIQKVIDILESVEGMLIRIDKPLVVGGTYYNLTGVLADDGKKDNNFPETYNSNWGGVVLEEGVFNTEILFVDYQENGWKFTNDKPLAQIGDHLKDSSNDTSEDKNKVFRGVMDYTDAGLYMARPIQEEYKSVTGETIPKQGWDFEFDSPSYEGKEDLMKKPKTNQTKIKNWRTGDSCDAKFKPNDKWSESQDDSLTVAAFNLENYEPGSNGEISYNKDKDFADIVKNNMKYPDVIVIVEMGDDVNTLVNYDNQWNSFAPKDGYVSAVKNFTGLCEKITDKEYDFRQIDPKEQMSGGAPGTNIRVGFMFNTDRVEFVDRGIVTNYKENTKDKTSPKQYPLPVPGNRADELADTNTIVAQDENGKPYITQSPGYIQDSSFNRSRNPLVGEFKARFGSKETFFVVACHFGSKSGDSTLYGNVQPPVFASESNRNNQARAVNKFVQDILNIDSNAKVIVAGDMNEFAFSPPLKILSGEYSGRQILWSPAEMFMPKNERFSYSFQGNLQQIDHIYVSSSLYNGMKEAGAKEWTSGASDDWKNYCFIPHINSPFSRNNNIDFSDHDPDLVNLKGCFKQN